MQPIVIDANTDPYQSTESKLIEVTITISILSVSPKKISEPRASAPQAGLRVIRRLTSLNCCGNSSF